ncbi:uncharacterized protein [Branchiostoma lanceolatum]|uniref:uncharacterized protein isoform X2 n=1 Tax=Branchiostoma lanceolatum TaxID=7740 RepID=UPI003452C607
MAEFDFLENPRLMRVPTKKWIANPCERILVPDKDFVYMLEIQDVPVRARDKFIHWRMMTSEEEQTFKECEHERFWTRSVPFMIGVSAITTVLSRRAKYNLWQKAICQYAALTVGRDLGHFTYWYLEHERWAERFMHLQGSTYGEALRRRDCQLQRWYPKGAPPIPQNLLYTRQETPSALPPLPPYPSPYLITASLSSPAASPAVEPQVPSDIDEKYTDYSIEYSSPLFTSSLGEVADLDKEEATIEQEENHTEVTVSSSDNGNDKNDQSVPSSPSPHFPSFPPPAFPSSSPPAFPSSSPSAFPASLVNWDEDDATLHEDDATIPENDDATIQEGNVLSDDSNAVTEDIEEVLPEKEKRRNIYGDIIEEDIQGER